MKSPGSKLIVISTAGQGADSALGRLRTRALAQPKIIRKGGFTDAHGPNLRMLEWSLPEDADLDDMKAVKAVNPASWITAADPRRTARSGPGGGVPALPREPMDRAGIALAPRRSLAAVRRRTTVQRRRTDLGRSRR